MSQFKVVFFIHSQFSTINPPRAPETFNNASTQRFNAWLTLVFLQCLKGGDPTTNLLRILRDWMIDSIISGRFEPFLHLPEEKSYTVSTRIGKQQVYAAMIQDSGLAEGPALQIAHFCPIKRATKASFSQGETANLTKHLEI